MPTALVEARSVGEVEVIAIPPHRLRTDFGQLSERFCLFSALVTPMGGGRKAKISCCTRDELRSAASIPLVSTLSDGPRTQ